MGIQFFQITHQNICHEKKMIFIQNFLKNSIFSLQKTKFLLTGTQEKKNVIKEPLLIQNFDIVEWKFIQYNGNNLELQNNNRPIDLYFKDSIFSGSISNIGFFIQNNVFLNVRLEKIYLLDLRLNDLIWLDYKSNTDQSQILIDELIIKNCVFENVTLFSFHSVVGTISIKKISIIGCKLRQTIIFKYNSTNTESESCSLHQFLISDSVLQQSTLVLHNGGQIELNLLRIYSSIFNNSVLIQAQCNTNLIDLQIVQVTFISSIMFKADIQENYFKQLYYDFNQLFFEESYFSDSILFFVHSQKQIRTEIRINNISHLNIYNIGDKEQQKFLYDLKCNYLVIQFFNITNSHNLSFVSIGQTEKTLMSDITFINSMQAYKVQLNYECHFYLNIVSALLKITGFSQIILERFDIRNQYGVDNPIIDITSDVYFQITDQEIIKINQISFQGNILIKTQLATVFSQLVIYSPRPQLIILSKIKFHETFFNQLIDDPSKTGASLIFIDSKLSTITFDQLICQSNGLTNSSYSFLFTNSILLTIQNITVQNSNLFINHLWAKYYQLEVKNNMTMSDSLASKMIQQIFSISNIGGVAKIIASKIYLNQAFFQDIIAESRSIFDITTQGSGEIILYNMFIKNVQSSLISNLLSDGCITISSQNSMLQLQAKNLLLKKIYNRLNSAIFTIYTSKRSNQLEFLNVEVVDCFSLLNEFILAEFSKESVSHLIFNNLTINNTEFGLSNYLSEVEIPSSLEIIKIKSGNAQFNLINCNVIFQNIFITGPTISPILILSDSQISKLQNFRVQNIKLLYPFHLMQFTKISYIPSTLIIKNLEIIDANQIFRYQDTSFREQITSLNIILAIENCFIKEIDQSSVNLNNTINALIALLNYEQSLTGSLLQISGLSKLAKVQIVKLNINKNICNFCYDGMVSIQSASQSKIIFEELRCLTNDIKKFGCLVLKTLEQSTDIQSSLLLMQDSSLIKNNGTIGAGVFSANWVLKMKHSVFLSNNGINEGGAVFLQDVDNFKFQKCFFFENVAQIGGGIYLPLENELNKVNFEQSLALFNKAILYPNNLVEAPNHLTLSINNQEIKSIIRQEGEQLTQIIQLKPYQLIDKSIIYTTYLYLPSGQEILNYKIFDEKKRVYISYINEISMIFKNSLNEELIGDPSDYCQIYTITPQGVQNGLENKKLGNIKFNSTLNKFDFGGLKIIFNPYNEPHQYLVIQIECQSVIENKQLNYQINAKTFPCQLGEFFTNDQCQMCEPSFGFYSVTQNASFCSIFDSTKFEKITSNQIKIKPNFWRSSFISNSVELCFKNYQYCQGGWGVGNDLCFTGHIGGLCEECDTYNIRGDGFYVKTSTLECGACTESSIQKLPFIFLIIWSFISMLLSLKSNQNTNKTFAKLRVTTKLYEILFKLTQNFESILLKMFLNYLWIFSAIFTFNITFDFSLNAIDSISTPSAAVANNMDCELSQISETQLIYVRIISMIVFLLTQILVISIGMKIYSLWNKLPFEYSIVTNATLYLFLSNQSALIRSLSSLIAVRTISDIQYIQGNVSSEFYQEKHIQWIFSFILPCLLIFSVLIPLTLFLILFFNKHQFNQINFRKHLGYLFNEYNKENQFWEQARTLQKTIIIIFLTSFETNVVLKACLISLTVLFYQLLAQIRKPYIIKSLNELDITSGQIILIAIFSALIKQISEQNLNNISSAIFQIIIILLLLYLCQLFISRIVILYFKKYQLEILNFLKKITSILCNTQFINKFFSQKQRNLLIKKKRLELNFEKLRSIKNLRKKHERSDTKLLTTKFQLSQKYQLMIPKKQNI